ncbi:hypothetical protein SFRURICE_016995 [Spodoptera frugiperda]|nr:hypothetical protein SFRURICE_016995 [Spodoptera frugiperda]
MKYCRRNKKYKVKMFVENTNFNNVDNDMEQMLKPLNLFQTITFYPKYSIKNNKIIPSTLITNFFTLAATIVFSLNFLYRIYRYQNNPVVTDKITFFFFNFESITYCAGYFINFFLSVFRTNDNITLIITIQEINRFLNDRTGFRRFTIWNWINGFMIFGFYTILITYFTTTLKMSAFAVVCSFINITVDINQIYVMRIIEFLKDKVVLLEANILKYGNEEGINNDDNIEDYCEKVLEVYIDIRKCYGLIESLFRLPVIEHFMWTLRFLILYVTVTLVIQTLIQIQMTIVLLGMEFPYFVSHYSFFFRNTKILIAQSVFLWMSKNISMMLLLNGKGEGLYRANESLRETCLQLLGTTSVSGQQKKLLKNILRIHASSHSKLSVFGLFDLDAELDVATLTIIVNYTFVLLHIPYRMEHRRQFNLLHCSYVDKDVQSMFLPLNLMQTITFNPKYQIKNNFVHTNHLGSNIFSLCGLITFLALNASRIFDIFDENLRRYQTVNFIYFATVIDCLFYSSGYIMNFIHHLIYSKDNVTFILTFQDIHRFINNKSCTDSLVKYNWIHVIVLFICHIFVSFYIYIVYMHPPWYIICFVFILITTDCNTVYAIALTKLLTNKVQCWNTRAYMSLTNGSHIMRCNHMVHVYSQILHCYNIFKKMFRWPVNEEKKLCRNIQRLHRVSFSKMSPFGLFYEDMRHTLHVLELLTNYIVVLLQFALL